MLLEVGVEVWGILEKGESFIVDEEDDGDEDDDDEDGGEGDKEDVQEFIAKI